MSEFDSIQLFEEQPIRAALDAEAEEWYFSVVDVVGVLTEQQTYDGARNYWRVLKKRLKDERAGAAMGCGRGSARRRRRNAP